MKTNTVRLPDYLAEGFHEGESSISKILRLGLKQLKIEKAKPTYDKSLDKSRISPDRDLSFK